MVHAAVPPEPEPVAKRPGDDLVRRFLRGSLLSLADARARDAGSQPLQPSELSRGTSAACPKFISSLFHLIGLPRPEPDRSQPERPHPEQDPRPGPPPDRQKADLPNAADA